MTGRIVGLRGRGKGQRREHARRRASGRKGKKAAWMDDEDRHVVSQMAWRMAFEYAWRVTCQEDAERLSGEAFAAACAASLELSDMPDWSGAREHFEAVFAEMFSGIGRTVG